MPAKENCKSTLMRSIAGILPPTTGKITVNGRISTLLALGVGFNKALSGRDNIILGGLAAGMSKAEIESQTDAIAAFADLPEGFIDMPVRTYSNGMYSRVAFAVAVNMTPDILLLDEALSAGDASFKEKSLNRVKELRSDDRALILVSHAMQTLRDTCNDVAWLHKGKLIQRGEPNQVIDAYQEFLHLGKSAAIDEDV